MRISLKTKLLITFLAVILIGGITTTLAGRHLIATGIIQQAEDRVRNDLNSAHEVYRSKMEAVKDVVRFTAIRDFMKAARTGKDYQKLTERIASVRSDESLDILTFTDDRGVVLARTRNPGVTGDSVASDELVSEVLSQHQTVVSTEIVSREELLKESGELAERASMKFVLTPKAKPRPGTEETSGMMIKAAAPVFGHDGHFIGVLYGGKLLNRDYEIVDKIKDIVYKGDKYKGKDIGTATIFEGDLRISTNVKREDGTRAIGTRVSEDVYDQVLVLGLLWTNRAFVVNNWYLAAYEPIRNVRRDIVGMLYVGILEEKFTDMKRRAMLTFLGLTGAGMIGAFAVSGFLARSVLHPVRTLVDASHQWAQGHLDHRVEIAQKDELGELAETFNLMASSLKDRDQKLREYAEHQIMKSEKLATLGQLAAGVAHEINNPLGGILMYVHLALEETDLRPDIRDNLQKAATQTTRCKDIVQGLLDFARQTAPKFADNSVNDLIERTLSLVQNQSLFHNVRIDRHLSPVLPKITMDAGQMQQVFTNMVLNGAQAMEGNGILTVTSRMRPDGEHIEIEFKDTGHGISPENKERLFDPFFTTKEVGTGLGLAVSYGIISRHKGDIEVRSEPGKGAEFIIRLPIRQQVEV